MGFSLSDVHGMLALGGLLAAVGSVIVLKKSDDWTGQLSGFAAVVLIVVTITGFVLWYQGNRPAAGLLGILHVLLGIGATAHAVLALRPRPANVKRRTLTIGSVMALLALLIGHLA